MPSLNSLSLRSIKKHHDIRFKPGKLHTILHWGARTFNYEVSNLAFFSVLDLSDSSSALRFAVLVSGVIVLSVEVLGMTVEVFFFFLIMPVRSFTSRGSSDAMVPAFNSLSRSRAASAGALCDSTSLGEVLSSSTWKLHL